FSFYTSVSAVFSSKIEGEDIDLDSFIRHKRFGAKYQPDYTQKIDDLYEAYVFAQQHQLSPEALEKPMPGLPGIYYRSLNRENSGRGICMW
ncbi:MAG: hypothetical protein JNM88_20990, partial [Chitinophagaceae bacterium]|nr:hypothetical protein [Chitinophagaceae bacterium]